MPPALRYYNCKISELATFTRGRKLRVHSTAKYSKTPTRSDYIRALKAADREPSFSFLDLSPELRTNIYLELLVLQDSFTCYPQILRTCKLIHDEAINVLYGENLIEVRINIRGVSVHNQWLSTFPWQTLEWPGFVRRTQFLQIRVSETVPWDLWMAYLSPTDEIYRIMHSLCSFLRQGHRLRSLQVNLTPITRLQANNVPAWEEFEHGMTTMLCPLRLLSDVITVDVKGILTDLQSMLRPSADISRTAAAMVAGHVELLNANLQYAEELLDTIVNLAWADTPRQEVTVVSNVVLGMTSGRAARMLNDFYHLAEMIRSAWDPNTARLSDLTVMDGIQRIAQLEVELKLRHDEQELISNCQDAST